MKNENSCKIITIVCLQLIFAGCASQQSSAEYSSPQQRTAENRNMVIIRGNMGPPATENSTEPLEQGRWQYVKQHPELPESMKRIMLSGGVQVRWTADEARASWGQPDNVQQLAVGKGNESWIYPLGYILDFSDGVVIRVHASGSIYKDGQE